MQATRALTGIDPERLSPAGLETLRTFAILLATGYNVREIAAAYGLRQKDVEQRLAELRAELSGDARSTTTRPVARSGASSPAKVTLARLV